MSVTVISTFSPIAPGIGQVQPNAATAQVDQQAQQASASVADYMNQNGIDEVDADDLHAVATNRDGDVPADAQAGASFLLANPGVLQRIETHDRPGSDGKSSVRNFERAAQGDVPLGAGMTATPVASSDASGVEQQAQSASATLGQWMDSTGTASVKPNDLYALAINKGGEVPQQVQQAAGFMLAHPAVYQQIETLDVAGCDGKSGAGNFEQVANAPLPGASSAAPSAPSAQPVAQPIASTPMQATAPTAPLAPAAPAAQAAPAAPTGNGIGMQQILQLLQMLVSLMQAAGMGQQAPAPAPPGASPLATALSGHATPQQMRGASGVLANYMQNNGMNDIDLKGLNAIASNSSGNVPQEAQIAARMMLANPNGYRAVETHDVAQADGKSGVWNFAAAAQGQVAF